MFVHPNALEFSSEAELEPGRDTGVIAHTARPARAADGWSCPGCSVENRHSEYGDGEVVECDYCGAAFALADG